MKQSGPGVILLVYSVLLTKGLVNIVGEKDMEDNTLINELGYASQELINLMLTGMATSNAHDGDIEVDETIVLRGVHRPSEIGYLTFFEHFE